jgi:hypothetical protein
MPQPDEDIGEAQWNLPEVLRVNAELLLWHGGPDAVAGAEVQLLRPRDLARGRPPCHGNYARRRAWRSYGSAAGGWPRRGTC